MRTTPMLTLAAMLVAGTATAAVACGTQASLNTAGMTVAAAQDLSAASKKDMTDTKMNEGKATTKKMATDKTSGKKMMKRSTTGAPASVNPSGGPGTGTASSPKSSSTGNAGTGAGAAGGASAGAATNSGH